MNTLGNKTNTKVTRELSWALNLGFPAASEVLKGQMVKLNASGEVEPIAAVTDTPIGMVTKGAKTAERATVQTNFSAVLTGRADGAVTTGNELSVSGWDTPNLSDQYAPSAATNVVCAIALSDAADTEEVEVGIIINQYVKA